MGAEGPKTNWQQPTRRMPNNKQQKPIPALDNTKRFQANVI
jgi:hypothetical protein